MKTPEEVKKGLWCCQAQYSASCGKCPYSNDGRDCGRNGVQIMKDALTYIQQLEAELEAIKMEVDMAVSALHGDCGVCMFQQTAKCDSCRYGVNPWYVHDCWEWEGVCPENTEVQGDA
jgi:hypothetical protein